MEGKAKKTHFPHRKKHKRKEKYFPKQINKNNKTKIKCFKCGKIVHYANRCYTRIKINELEDEGLKKFLYKIMIISDTDSEESIKYYTDSSLSGEQNHYGCTVNTIKNSVRDNFEYWKAIFEMNGLSINVTTSYKIL